MGHAPLLIPVATMGKCKQANKFQSPHYGHLIINYSRAESAKFVIQGCPTLMVTHLFKLAVSFEQTKSAVEFSPQKNETSVLYKGGSSTH